MKTLTRLLAGLIFAMVSAAYAGTINVTAPLNGDFLGRSNTLKFTITGSNAQAKVIATVSNVADSSITFRFQQNFTPDVDHQIQGNLSLNFNDTTPQGAYSIVVTVEEPSNPYNSVTLNPVTIDVVDPRFRDFSPALNAFVRGTVQIRATLEEPNIDEWRVQINGQDIPNNTGSSTNVLVTWNTALITHDGSQTVTLKVTDKAGNQATKNIPVTLDRVAPSIFILSPTVTPFRPNATIPVLIDFQDQFAGSVVNETVDVIIKDMAGNVLGRVARVSSRISGTALQWTGRIRNTRSMPRQFKIVVTAVDKAGNTAATQEVTVNLRG